MLAKIALIIAAAQIQITAANFISTQTNTPSKAAYAMSNEEQQTIFEAFKNEIERNVQPKKNNSLSEADRQNIQTTIQNFIHHDDEKALALYIANQWGIINGLGWRRDAVPIYVQSCLLDLYNLEQQDNTIQIDNRAHCAIAQRIGKLLATDMSTNKLLIKLIKILLPHKYIKP